MAQFQPYKVSGAYRAQVALNAKWTNVDGWRLPESFGSAEDEASRVRRGVGLQDVSALGKLDLKGTGLDARVADCERLDGVRAVLRHKPGHAIVLSTSPAGAMRDAIEAVFAQSPGCVHVTDVSSGLAVFALVGPAGPDVLAGLTSIDLRPKSFGNEASAPCMLAHVHATVYRGDWGSLRAYLLIVNREAAEHVWTTIHHAGHKHGLTPFGIAAERLLQDQPAAVAPRAQAAGVNAL